MSSTEISKDLAYISGQLSIYAKMDKTGELQKIADKLYGYSIDLSAKELQLFPHITGE